MRIPYIRLQQRGEVFYLCRFKVSELLPQVDFHFREPYADLQNPSVILKNTEYIERIRKKGIELQSSEEGIQRRLQLDRINSIARYVTESVENFLPSAVIVSADMSADEEFESRYLEYEKSDNGFFEFPPRTRFFIIDGQHRLAGLSLLERSLQEQFDLAAVVLFNVSKPTAAKLFADINGKQKPVNRSLIYDLYGELPNAEFRRLNQLHTICRSLYSEKFSPLYRQIKMLGIGSGAISQAFFIDYAGEAIAKTTLLSAETQEIYNQLFYYFAAFQKTFPDDWPVPLVVKSDVGVDAHASTVLKIRKSQLVKTNGFGALLRVFPRFFELSHGRPETYLELVGKLKHRIDWTRPTAGTGKAYQNSLVAEIEKIVFSHETT